MKRWVPDNQNLNTFSEESKNKGKSAGARVIYFFVTNNNEVYLIHIFDKSQFENVPKLVLLDLLKNAGLL